MSLITENKCIEVKHITCCKYDNNHYLTNLFQYQTVMKNYKFSKNDIIYNINHMYFVDGLSVKHVVCSH